MTSWFFIEMAAKSALICAVALLLALAIRDRAASDRARVLRIGVGVLLALPLIDTFLPVLEIEAFAAPASLMLTDAELRALMASAAGASAVEPSIWDDPAPLILLLWAAGALAVATRLVIGLTTLRNWTRAATPATDPVWLAALERARAASGAPANLRLLVADKVPGPLGWGFRNPVILVDVDTYTEREEADAIMAHEVAHVARGDWAALMATRLATTLFWFNPLVWALARESVQQAEEAADAAAAHMVEPTRYAETLLSWAQIGRGIAVPANSIAPARGLARRVRAVLEPKLRERSAGSRVAVMAMLVCVGLAAPVAALELVAAAEPEAAPRAPAALAMIEPAAPPAPVAAATAVAVPAAAPAAPRARASRRPAQAPRAPAAPDTPAAPDLVAAVAPALDSARLVLPQVPVIVAAAVDQLDGRKLAHYVRRVRLVDFDEHDLDEERGGLAAADLSGIEARIRASLPDPAAIRVQVRNGMIAGGEGMMRGAEGMERGAATMEAQARRFRDRAERERIIARERERGHDVTHDQLLAAAEEMCDGAREMRQGAREMRRNAREMMSHH